MTEIYKNITIDGNENFIKRTKGALNYIANRAPDYMAHVVEHIGVIRQASQSGVHVTYNPPVFDVGYRTFTAGAEWYSSCIVHDATHVWLYRQGKPYSGREAEDVCLIKQREFLAASNSSQANINYITYLLDNRIDYFSNPKRKW